MGNVSAYRMRTFTTATLSTAVSLSYSANRHRVACVLAMFSEPVTTIPTITIDQPGTEDLSPRP